MSVSINPAEAEAVQNAMAAAESQAPVVENPEQSAQSAVPNENQDHPFSADESPEHVQADPVELGEHDARVAEPTKFGGRHVRQAHPQKADGQKQKANVDREKHVAEKRKESEKGFASKRRSVAPNHRGKK